MKGYVPFRRYLESKNLDLFWDDERSEYRVFRVTWGFNGDITTLSAHDVCNDFDAARAFS